MQEPNTPTATGGGRHAAMPAAHAGWVRGRVQDRLRVLDLRATHLSKRTIRDRVEAVTAVYRELWALGYRVERLESLAPRHLHALLESWKQRGLSRETARVRWVHLVRWCIAVGKPGMAPSFNQAWPATPDRSQPRVTLLSKLPAERYAALLASLGARPDRTLYWLVRAMRELELSREEALLFEPHRTLSLSGDVVLVWSAKGRKQRAVHLASAEMRSLVGELAAYMSSVGKSRLGWRDLGMADGMRKLANGLSYALKTSAQAAGKGDR